MGGFAGGRYAVTTCNLHDEPNEIETRKQLCEWVRCSGGKWHRTHGLEMVQDPQASEEDLVLELYLPIEESEVYT